MSEKLNLVEQINLILNIINYAIIDPNNNKIADQFACSRIKPKIEDIIENLEEYVSRMQQSIDSIHKSDLVEIKAFKAPPAAVLNVAEAICYLFSKTPSFQNFKLIIGTTDFIYQLQNFDLETLNDYKLEQLKKYIEMEDFNPEYIKKISSIGSILCNWIINIYNFSSLKKVYNSVSFKLIKFEYLKFFKLKKFQFCSSDINLKLKTQTSNQTLSSYLFENSFFMFNWYLYYQDQFQDVQIQIEVDELITKSLNLESRYILTLDDLNYIFLSNQRLKEYQSKHFEHLFLKYARAESARGRFLLDEKSKILITDMNWFKNIIDIMSKAKTSDQTLINIFGPDLPIFNLNDLKEELKNLIPSDQIFNNLILFLTENNLITLTSKNNIISLFCIKKNQNPTIVSCLNLQVFFFN